MKAFKSSVLVIWFIAAGIFAAVVIETYRIRVHLGNPAVLSGWCLFLLMLTLASFNVRKRLSMLPLGSANTWLLLHAVGGLLAMALFWLHTQVLWPQGFYERALALSFYIVSVNGIIGYILQRIYPPRLTQTGLEIIYERIPLELAQIRESAEHVILDCTKETGSETLAQHYLQTLDWFFRRPRFFTSHALGGQKGNHWIRNQCATVRRYLNQAESGYLEKIASLAEIKNKMDYHFAAQSVMKGWLLIHVSLAVMVITLMVWHLIVVHIYLL